MMKPLKILLSLLVLVVVAILILFGLNASDESLHENTLALLQKPSAQTGYPTKNLRGDPKKQFNIDGIDTYQEYKKEAAKYDKLLADNDQRLTPLLEAFQVGHIEVNPDKTALDNLWSYPYIAHRLFIFLVSQKVAQGKTAEALSLIEKSNSYLVDILQSPETIINKQIALSVLQQNLNFVRSLSGAGVIKKTPMSLKASFEIKKTAEEIWAEAAKYEFLLSSPLIGSSELVAEGFTNISDSNPSGDVANGILKRFHRPHQTLNWSADILTEILNSPECASATGPECSKTFLMVTESPLYKFINPIGRKIVEMVSGNPIRVRKKIQDKMKSLSEGLKTL